jgi:hypothetical protein
VLNAAFNLLAKLPTIGPHNGYEKDLLIAGVKPIGLYAVLDDKTQANAHTLKDYADMEELDAHVAKGKLGKFSYQFRSSQGHSYTSHTYHQPAYEADARELSEAFEAYHHGDRSKYDNLSKPVGRYLGYTWGDQKLFDVRSQLIHAIPKQYQKLRDAFIQKVEGPVYKFLRDCRCRAAMNRKDGNDFDM